MKVLGIETSGNLGGFAVTDDGHVVAETISEVTGRHLEKGGAMIEALLQDAAVKLDDLGGVAVSLGPGSFTGLRVGLALAKGICFGKGLPLAGVPTLDCIAEGLSSSTGLVVPVKDARRGEVYFCVYEVRPGRVQRLSEYQALSPDLLIDRLKANDPGFHRSAICERERAKRTEGSCSILLAGDALAKYGDVFRVGLGSRAVMAPEELWGARPGIVAGIGSRLLRDGRVVDLDTVEPIYVRASEAERKAKGSPGCGKGTDTKNEGR